MNTDLEKELSFAPDGATHYNYDAEYDWLRFYRVSGGKIYSWWGRKQRWEETETKGLSDLCAIDEYWPGGGLPPIGKVVLYDCGAGNPFAVKILTHVHQPGGPIVALGQQSVFGSLVLAQAEFFKPTNRTADHDQPND